MRHEVLSGDDPEGNINGLESLDDITPASETTADLLSLSNIPFVPAMHQSSPYILRNKTLNSQNSSFVADSEQQEIYEKDFGQNVRGIHNKKPIHQIEGGVLTERSTTYEDTYGMTKRKRAEKTFDTVTEYGNDNGSISETQGSSGSLVRWQMSDIQYPLHASVDF